MRVLHLDSGKEMGGGQWQVLRLLGGLAARGVEQMLLARAGSPLLEAARERGFEVGEFGVLRALGGRRFDLVHAHDARGHSIGLLTGAPLVVARRVAFPVRSRWKYGRGARYIAVSEFVKSVLAEGGVDGARVSVVYDGVPLLEQAAGGSVVSLAKGAEVASEAAILAGEGIHVARNPEKDLAHAGMMIYVTECEGLGSGVLLAMSAGVPVIASNVGGIREIVQHEENGLLVSNDAREIARAIQRLRGDSALARRLGAAGRRTVMERFTVDRMVDGTMQVYRQVLG